MKRYKIREDKLTGEWHLLRKEMDQNSRFRWVIDETCSTYSQALRLKREKEE